ncbi:MAG: hypothetical protein HYZ75_14515 [Elusimicrobia bacterium]|nr:hypothetical protein [Elusimicrobiota bacterium]
MTPRRVRRPSRLKAAVSPLAAAVLAPTAACALWAAASAAVGVGARGDGLWFAAGAATWAACDLLGLRLRRAYVFAHELTHALAAWAGGGKVFAFVVRGESGRVDLSHVSPFVALAPYWIPLYALGVAGVYRLAIWGWGAPRAREAFLAAMGAALAFHLFHTGRSLLETHQSDLDEAGPALSLALIALLNAGLLLFALKCLFPERVDAASAFDTVRGGTAAFWGGAVRLAAGLVAR